MTTAADAYKEYYPKDRKTWRNWLEKNHEKQNGIWLAMYKKASGKPTVSYADAVEEALCFGWIDGQKRPVDEAYSIQLFTPRRPKSGWSKLNKIRIDRLTAEGQMMPAGLAKINAAKADGSWTILDQIEEMIVPGELEKAFRKEKAAKKFFDSLSPSPKKQVIYWVSMAKQATTRQQRIDLFLESAREGKLPERFRRPAKK
jgi:uncharacterized protein YdeI (YjbR/CyaY-like superfamily)